VLPLRSRRSIDKRIAPACACIEARLRRRPPIAKVVSFSSIWIGSGSASRASLAAENLPVTQSSLRRFLQEWFFNTKWYNVYNFIEFLMEYPKGIVRAPSYDVTTKARNFEEEVNRALYDEGSAFSYQRW
jgi:hypothetical protein